MTDSVENDVREFVSAALKVPLERVTRDARFVEDFGADSLGMIELVVSFEERFDVAVSEEESLRVRTVGDAIVLLERARAGAESPAVDARVG